MADNEQDASPVQKKTDIQKVYLKDLSFETPGTPDIFLKEWKPSVELSIDSSMQALPENGYEVVLSITATAKIDETVAYLAEVKQAGVFTLAGFTADELDSRHHTFCLRFLYPYACAALSDLVSKGGFVPLLMGPVNFRAMYELSKERENQGEESSNDQD